MEDIKNNPNLCILIEKKAIDRIILLDSCNIGEIAKVYII